MDWLDKSSNNHTIADLPSRPSQSARDTKINELIAKVNDLLALIVSDESRL
tara:strand:+ start:2101 stop:2253 length:153 start_codon:yes stop_codon:yes gene_type:complete